MSLKRALNRVCDTGPVTRHATTKPVEFGSIMPCSSGGCPATSLAEYQRLSSSGHYCAQFSGNEWKNMTGTSKNMERKCCASKLRLTVKVKNICLRSWYVVTHTMLCSEEIMCY